MGAAIPWARRGHPRLNVPTPPAHQVSVYLQNWSHVLSYVSKAESTPEIAEVTGTLPTSSPLLGVGLATGEGVERQVAHVCRLPLQQRGERDSQTQAILTKLKCAAGEGLGPGGRAPLLPPRCLLWVACVPWTVFVFTAGADLHPQVAPAWLRPV